MLVLRSLPRQAIPIQHDLAMMRHGTLTTPAIQSMKATGSGLQRGFCIKRYLSVVTTASAGWCSC